MKVKEESEKACLNIYFSKKTKTMASGPTTSGHIVGETMEKVKAFTSFCSKITAVGNCNHEIKRRLLLGRKAITNMDNVLKNRDITLPTKVHIVKVMVLSVVIYGCDLRAGPQKMVNTRELMHLN